MTIVGSKKMVVWDDLDGSGPIKVYDKHVEKTSTYYQTYGEFQLLSKEGSTTTPRIAFKEPLKAQGKYFIDCIRNKKSPHLSDAKKGMDVVDVLTKIQRSVDKKGSYIKI